MAGEGNILTTEELFGTKKKTFTTEELFGGKQKPLWKPPAEQAIIEVQKGIGEAGIKLGEMILKFIPTGILEGIRAISPEGTTVNDIATAIQEPIQKFTYTPETEIGKVATYAMEWPFRKLDEWGDIVGDEVRKNSLEAGATPEAAAIVATTIGGGIKGLPYLVGLKSAIGKLRPSKIITDRKAFEKVYPPEEGLTLEPDIAVAGKEPSITLDQLKTTPSLADYVNKRPQVHPEEVTEYAKKFTEEVKPSEVSPEVKVEGVKPVELQTTIIPGAKEFIEQDIIPKVQQFGTGLKDTWEGFKHLVSPRSGVSREILDAIMKKKGGMDKATTILEATTRDVEKAMDKWSEQEQIDFFDRIKKGEPEVTPQRQQMQDMLRTMDDGLYDALEKVKPSMPWIENHFRVLYKTIPRTVEEGIKGIFRRPLEGGKGYFKQHTLADLSEGIALGGEPLTYNPMRMFRYHYADVMKYLTTQEMWKEFGDIGAREFVRFGAKPPEGFTPLNDRIAKIYVPTSKWGGQYISTEAFKESVSESTKVIKEKITEIGRKTESIQYGKVEERALEALRARGWSEGEATQIVDRIKKAEPGEAKDRIIERQVEKTIKRMAEIKTTTEFVPGKGFVYAGEWYVEEGAGRLLNGFLSRDRIRETAIGRGIMWVKNSTTAIELGFFNTFHGTFEALEATASAVGHGTRTIWNEGILKANAEAIVRGGEEILKGPIASWERSRIGGGFVRYIENKEAFLKTTRGDKFIKQIPEVETLIDDLFGAGLKGIGIHEDYRIGSIKTFQESLSSNNYIGAALRSIPALNEVLMKPLFDVFIPRLKIGMWAKEFSAELARKSGDIASGKITRSELARDIWDFTENRFGEMNFDNIFWDRTFKTGLQAMIRSVTWKLGNIKLFGKAPIEQAKEFANAFKERRMPELTQEMAWVWGIAVTHATISSIVQTLFTGEPPSEFKDFFWPKVDKEGNRVSPATYMRDLFSLISSPIKYVQHSMAGYIGRFIEVLNNKNFYGVEVHDSEDNWAQQRIDDLVHMVPTPFGISSMLRLHEQGLPIERAIIANFGFTKAPYYIEQSKAEQLAGELIQGYFPTKPRTKEEFERAKVRKEYAQEIQKILRDKPQDLPNIIKKMAQDIEAKKLSMDDIDKITARLKEPLIGKVSRLSLYDAFKIWEVASDEEKIKLKDIIVGKIGRTRDIEELEKLKPQIDKFINETTRR